MKVRCEKFDENFCESCPQNRDYWHEPFSDGSCGIPTVCSKRDIEVTCGSLRIHVEEIRKILEI
jgi:hypothetical protein